MRVLLTAGPTREYLDDVRYLSNASSGQMGYALAAAIRDAGHDVILVSGPVALAPPANCEIVPVETTREMYEACLQEFPRCDGVIAVAAVCDYRPVQRSAGKLAKTGGVLRLELEETEDILATLGAAKGHRWVVGFALEPGVEAREKALRKLREKGCDAIVLNHPSAIGSSQNSVAVLLPDASTALELAGTKTEISQALWDWIASELAASGPNPS